MIVLLALSLVLPAAAAYATLRLVPSPSPAGAAAPGTLALRAGLSLLLGQGAGSLVAYAWLVAGGTIGRTFAVADAALFALVLGIALRGRRRIAAGASPGDGSAPTRLEWAAIAAAAAGVTLVAGSFVSDVLLAPHGDWDAWAIWNLRARFLSRGGDAWRLAFAPDLSWSNLGYPLLLPASVARLWAYAGETIVAPAAAAGLYAIAPMLVLFGAVARRSGVVAGAAATLLLAGTEQWLLWGPSQGADLAVASFVVAGVASLLEAEVADGRRRAMHLALAGALFGLASWTKDEGIMFAGVFAAWAIVRGGRGALAARAAWLGVGLALPALARIHFQVTLAPGLATALTGSGTAGTLDRVLDPDRWTTILAALPVHGPGVHRALPLVALLLAAILGARLRDVPRSGLVPVVAAYAAFLLVYAATPLPLEYHLTTSASRVLLQPWPALLLASFALAPPPDADAGTPRPMPAPHVRAEPEEG